MLWSFTLWLLAALVDARQSACGTLQHYLRALLQQVCHDAIHNSRSTVTPLLHQGKALTILTGMHAWTLHHATRCGLVRCSTPTAHKLQLLYPQPACTLLTILCTHLA